MYQSEGRVPPCDKNAEEAVLGAILLSAKAFPAVAAIIDSNDFYIENYRRIYAAMQVLAERGIAIDHVTLGNELITRGDLAKIGGPLTLDGLTEACATTANVEHYANIVKKKSAVRRVIHCSQAMVAEGYGDHDDDRLTAAFAPLEEAVMALSRTRMPASLLAMGPQVLEMYDRVAHGYTGVPLPWPTVNAMTSGMWPKTMTMFVARPGTGKTFVAVISARHAWQEGVRTLVVSPEMSKMEIAERFFSIHSTVSYLHMIKGTVGEYEMPRLQEASVLCQAAEGLYIMDAEDDITPKGIEAAIRACRPGLVAIDSLYDLRIKGERRDKLLVALDWFKGALKRFDLAGVGFVQLNRAAEISEKKGGGVRLGTIALADEIGQDSHAVFALEQDKDMRADHWLKIKPLKLRRGVSSTESVSVRWDFDEMAFAEIPPEEGEEFKDDVPF
jgi:replicative DNA helicase